MSPLPVRMVLKKEVVLNSVAEFLGCWAVGGKATLSLNTQDGVTTITFSNTFSGHPGAPLHPPPGSRLTGARRRRRNASIRTRMCEDANFNGMVRESAALRQGDERPATSDSAVPGASLASRGRSTGR